MPNERLQVFRVEGTVQLEELEKITSDIKLTAFVYDRLGQPLGQGEVSAKGTFSIQAKLSQPADVEVLVAPGQDAKAVRRSSAYVQKFTAKDWKAEENKFIIKPGLVVPAYIWKPWWPLWICVSGHVRKVQTVDGNTEICPVPFVKVEVFDVDREFCWWPFIRRWWDILLDRRVFRIPDILKERPFPKPLPIPDPVGPISELSISGFNPVNPVSISPQPVPPPMPSPVSKSARMRNQSEVTDVSSVTSVAESVQTSFSRVGEMKLLDSSFAARLDNLTLTSKIAPWLIFPGCFYSKQLICETTTDEDGYFRCCFKWWPFHFRRGRLRYDARPDIIIRVTQVIDGVETVIYMDPYTSTRWNVTNAHIDLWLDNEDVSCGSGDDQDRPTGAQTFFTRVGDTEVYKITQSNGLYEIPPYSNIAFGGMLLIYSQFGDALSSGAPVRYYRLSHAKYGSPDSAFKPIAVDLKDTRVNKITNFSESYSLGPKTVNGVPALYEVRNFNNYYWYNPDKIGTWYTWTDEPDTGKYVLRLEVFDQNGNKLGSADVDYRDGTNPPDGVLPPMTDKCDLVITLDNKPPVPILQIPSVINDCGVIPWSSVPPLDFVIDVSQENGRLHSWRLQYTKGVSDTIVGLDSGSSLTGSPASVTKTVSGDSLLLDPGTTDGKLASTCAFALKLWAYAHITDGRISAFGAYPRFIYYREQIKAIAIEKCP